MVTEIIDDILIGAQGSGINAGGMVGVVGSSGQSGTGGPGTSGAQSVRGISRDRWGDIYANTPVKRMIALYDYDPQELSPNVDAEVSLTSLMLIDY